MILELDLHCGIPIYRQVMDQIRRQVITGRLAPGDRVEPVKSLSARLKVNPMTISKAYGYLVEEKLLERRRGIGLFVRPIRKETRKRLRTRHLRETLERAAVLAVQMQVSEDEACRLLAEQYRRHSPEKTRGMP